MEKTLTIAGGGLAGLACAIRLRERGWAVTVHERRRYPLKKVCGEFLSPQGWRRLQGLGAAGLLSQPPQELKRARFFSDASRSFAWDLTPPAWGLSRAAMDSALAERFRQLGGDLREGSEVELPTETEAGELWVDARGRPVVPGPARWWGWKAYLDPQTQVPALDRADLVMLPVKDGYCGLSRIEDGRISVCLVARDRATLTEVLTSHPVIAAHAAALSVHAAVARFDFKAYAGSQRIGDARRVWPPLVGDGMSQALAAGERMAQGLLSGQAISERVLPLQFALARGLHHLMLASWARQGAGIICRAVPALPRSLYRLSRG